LERKVENDKKYSKKIAIFALSSEDLGIYNNYKSYYKAVSTET
jgi:hypothetical protein